MPLHEKGNTYAVTLLVSDPTDPTKTMVYYPKSYAEGILLDLLDPSKTMAYHIEDGDPEKVHLTEELRRMLDNVGNMEGIVKLDVDGYIPRDNIPEKIVMLHYEFETYQDLLNSDEFTEEDHGRIVSVKDISSYPGRNLTGWAVVRLNGNPHNGEDWQLVWTEASVDRTADWSKFSELFRSTVAEIDAMVELSHTHPDLEALDSFSEDENGNLYYKGIMIPDRNNFRSLIYTHSIEGIDLLPGDVGIAITGEREATNVEPQEALEKIKTLSGDCTALYKDRVSMIQGPKIITTDVTRVNQMFMGCTGLLSTYSYDFNNVIESNECFKDCVNLVGTNEFGCASLISATSMYENSGIKYHPGLVAPYLQNLDCFLKNSKVKYFGNFTCPSLISAIGFAENCKELVEVNDMSIPNCTNISHAFKNCIFLERVNTLNTKRVKNFSSLFQGCTRLTQVISIDMSAAEEAYHMFEGCNKLKVLNFVPGTLAISISLANTSISAEMLKKILNDALTVSGETIDITGTPAAANLTDDIIGLAGVKGWSLVY